MTTLHPCPCCGARTLPEPPPGTYALCPVCDWEDDGVQFDDMSYAGGANLLSLEQARERYWRLSRAGALLREIVGRRDPGLLAWLEDLGRAPLSEERREGLRELLADELVERGLGEDDEPTTPYGIAVEELIDRLGGL